MAREAFGRMIRRWRELNGWSQYTGEAWAKAAGFDMLSHSGLSPLENGLTATPQWTTFGHFAEMNRRLACQNFTGVKRHELLAALSEARPMVGDDGVLLQEEELFGCHAGTRRIPAAYWVPPATDAPRVTDEDAALLCENWRQLVRDEAARRKMRLVRCLSELDRLVPKGQSEQFQDVLIGSSNYSAAELAQMWNGYELLPQSWIEAWLAGPKALAPSGGAVVGSPTNDS